MKTISVGDVVATKKGKVGVKHIWFNPIRENPNYLVALDKCELSDELNDFIVIVAHNNEKIFIKMINNIAI